MEQLKDTMPIFIRLFIVVAVSMAAGYVANALPLILKVLASLVVGTVATILLFRTHPDFRQMIKLLRSMIGRKK